MMNERKKELDEVFSLALQSIERLARVLFDQQEQMLPNGEVWEELSEEDRAYWISSATSVIDELKRIVEESGGG